MSKTLFENRQWQVTGPSHGKLGWLETVKPHDRYEIDAGGLLKTTDRTGQEVGELIGTPVPGDVFFDLPVHMAEKEWVDFDALEQAMRYALAHFYSLEPSQQEQLERSLDYGRVLHRETIE